MGQDENPHEHIAVIADIVDPAPMVNDTGKSAKRKPRKGVRPLADLIGATLDPICARRGFGSASLLSWWPDIVGPDYEEATFPESIHWPKRHDQRGADATTATLTVRVLPSQALFFQHEVPQVLERINQFLGYQAIGRVRIVQGKITRPDNKQQPPPRPLTDRESAELDSRLTDISESELQLSLKRLGAAILGDQKGK
ncbi:MAG: DciA family protein [Alphaproteobacteria bacterium]|nr:DciA family protein [Alphaproteobacteria bacterium]